MSAFSSSSGGGVPTPGAPGRYIPPGARGNSDTSSGHNSKNSNWEKTGNHGANFNGGRGRGGWSGKGRSSGSSGASTFTATLSAANLSSRNQAYQSSASNYRRGRDEDDDLETTSIFSRIDLAQNMRSSNHGIQRMHERDISIDQVSKVIKHGVKLATTQQRQQNGKESTIYIYHELIVILGSSDAKQLEVLNESAISSRIAVEDPNESVSQSMRKSRSHTVVTVYRDDNITNSGITGEEFWHWRKLLLSICSKDEHNYALMQSRLLPGQIEDPIVDFSRLFEEIRGRYSDLNRFSMMLNWTVDVEHPETNYGRTRQRTLLAVAAVRGYGRIVKLLLDHGANPGKQCRWIDKKNVVTANAVTSLFRSINKSFWVPPVVLEDIALMIAEHNGTAQEVMQEETRQYPLLHRAIHRGAARLTAHILQYRAYPNMLEIKNKHNETALTLAASCGMDLRPYLPNDATLNFPPFSTKIIQQIPEGYAVLPNRSLKFRMTQVVDDGFEKPVGGDVGGLQLLEAGSGEGLIFTIDQPPDIYGAPQTLGTDGLVRWSVVPSLEEAGRLSTLLANNCVDHDARFTQNTSVRHYDYKLELGCMVPGQHYLASDFAWRFYFSRSIEIGGAVNPIRQFYEDKLPIDVIIGNSYDKTSSGVFVEIDKRDGRSLSIQKQGSVGQAAVFRLYPEC